MRISELIAQLQREMDEKGDAVVHLCIDGAQFTGGSSQLNTTNIDTEWDGGSFLLTAGED